MANKVVSNTGPILHLTEINLINSLKIFPLILIPVEVKKELEKNKITIPKNIKILPIKSNSKDIVKILTNQEDLDLGEAEAITLALQEKAQYFLTDDLEARRTANKYNLKAHGTIGIVLRVFREKIINKITAIQKINELHTKSSLFITKDLIYNILKEIDRY